MSALQRVLATANRRAVAFKERRVRGAAGGSDLSSCRLCIRFNPRYRRFGVAEISAATITTTAQVITFTVNGVNDPLIGEYVGNTGTTGQIQTGDILGQPYQKFLDLVNGLDPGQFENGLPLRRWEGFIGDYPPGFILTANPMVGSGPFEALVGENASVRITHSSNSVLPGTAQQIQAIAGCGVSVVRGGRPVIPRGDEALCAQGSIASIGKAGGIASWNGDFGRSSRIVRDRRLVLETLPAVPTFTTFVEKFWLSDAGAGDTIFIMDSAARVVWADRHPGGGNLGVAYFPRIEVDGPAFVGMAGTSNIGEISVQGEIRY